MSRKRLPARGWLAFLLVLAGPARGGDRPPRELPPNAVQPPGASYEEHISGRQRARALRETIRSTLGQAVREPIGSAVVQTHRLFERVGVRVAERLPRGPVLPLGQDPEAGGPSTSARLTPLYDSGPAYQSLLDLIASARCRIDIMMFDWADDDVGRAVADALARKARSGVQVRVMNDRGGFLIAENNDHAARGEATFIDRLKAEPNARVIESPDPFFRFDHRKVAVIDDRVVWSGGMVLTRAALYRWHNFAFLAEGPIVFQYRDLFEERWGELGGPPAPACPQAAGGSAVTPNASVRMVRTDVGHRSLKEAIYGAIDTARHHVYLENPYFSDRILVKKLVAAAARGVDVRAVLTMRGDVRVMNKLSAITANQLFKGGARVYLYPAMTHVKAMSVDGDWVYMGTGNFDELSLRNNREVGLTVRGPTLVPEIEENLFRRDMAASQELRALLPAQPERPLLEFLSLWF